MKVPRTPPPTSTVLNLLASSNTLKKLLQSGLYSATVAGRYVHWDKLRFQTPPPGLTLEEWWSSIKLARLPLLKALPLLDSKGQPFRIASPDPMQRQLSEADRDLSGRVSIPDQLTNPGTRDRYMMSALIEEAITSSQLEGAATTRRVAREMLRSGRQPRDHGERMIHNNFEAMRYVRSIAKEPLTPELVLQVHRRVTDGTLQDPADSGRLRANDEICVYSSTDEVVHVPPPCEQLPSRLSALCDFSNERGPDYFIHPIVRAALLHFWIGYDHPFVDGNGRTARALFYWSMLHSGYWLCEFLSISHVLKRAPSQYGRSYLYSETDDNDATYFVLYQLQVLQRTIRDLHAFVQATIGVIHRTQALLRQSQTFNHRQLAVLGHALGNPLAQYTATAHANSHQVTRQTARTDLRELVKIGFLVETHIGNMSVFSPAQDLEDRLEKFEGLQSPIRP